MIHGYGIDYGIRRVAIASASQGVICDVDVGVRAKACSPLEALHIIVDTYCNAMVRRRADVVAIEAPIVGMSRNVRTGLQLSMVAGALAAVALQSGTAVLVVEPSTWKKAIVGNGGASKDDVSEYLARQHPRLRAHAKSQDAIDATCLALYAVRAVVAEGSVPGDAAGDLLREG